MVATADKSSEPESNKPKKRVLRATNETVRSQAERTTEKHTADATKLPSTFWGSFLFPFRMIGRGLKWIGHLLPFRILGRILFPSYFRNSYKELKQVTWPGRRESLRLTGAVLIFSIVFGSIVAIVDFGLDKLFKELILK